MKQNRIAFVAKAGVGKTTAALYLNNRYGFVKIALADKLKEICKDLWPEQFVNNNKPRELLQRVGTEGIRAYDPNVWVNYAIRTMNIFPYQNYTVDDVRFINEGKTLKENGFILVRIIGPQRTVMPEGTTSHVSEIEGDKIREDYTIQNTGTIRELYNEIDKIVEIYTSL